MGLINFHQGGLCHTCTAIFSKQNIGDTLNCVDYFNHQTLRTRNNNQFSLFLYDSLDIRMSFIHTCHKYILFPYNLFTLEQIVLQIMIWRLTWTKVLSIFCFLSLCFKVRLSVIASSNIFFSLSLSRVLWNLSYNSMKCSSSLTLITKWSINWCTFRYCCCCFCYLAKHMPVHMYQI